MSESRHQRWLKYGSNVALASIVAVALAALVTFAAQRKPWRIDTTASGLYSLKPQTIKIIRDLKTPIRLVSLYTHTKPPPSPDEDPTAAASVVPQDEAAQTVNDLLDEYANKGHDITVETIDPVTSPTKVDDLIEQVESRYGGEVKKYRDFVTNFKATIDTIGQIAEPEAKAVAGLPLSEKTDRAILVTLQEAFVTVQQLPKNLEDLQDALQRPLKQRPPDYKGAADAINEGMSNMATLLDAVVGNFTTLQKRGGLPPEIAAYMKDSLPHYQHMKDLTDDCVAQYKKLGELKLDTLRSALRERNTILVMGDKEWRAINYSQVWQPAARGVAASLSDAPPKPRFAGEQQVTAAILALASGGQKPKVAFVRAGGPPLAQSLGMFGGQPPMSDAADRLALYNFDVVEKDLTGQFAAESQGMVTEPSDDDIRTATWIVYDFTRQSNPDSGPPPSIARQVAEHLRQGGSAVIITGAPLNTGGPSDAMTEALSEWGVDLRTDASIVHEKISNVGGDTSNPLQQALRLPFVFELHEYGDHPLTKPLGGLDGAFVGMSPVIIHPMKGYQSTPLVPIPTAPDARAWGSTSYQPTDANATPTFNAAADVADPVFAGAAVERDNGTRLVVLGAGNFATNQMLELSADAIDPNAPPVIQFPGNGELFTNSVFWAAHQDTLIDISPAAMDVGRIRDISPRMLNFWRVGVLLVSLPLMVLVCGAGVYFNRRD